MTQGDLRYFDPGEEIPVRLKADGDGDVAERGDPVELVDETEGVTRVQLVNTDGEGIGSLAREPQEYDPDNAYGNDEEVGSATVLAEGPVDWYDQSDTGAALTPGDLAVLTTDGVRVADLGGADTVDMILGRVFATGTRVAAETANKVAVLRWK